MKIIAPITLLTATTLLTACGGSGSTAALTLAEINAAGEEFFLVSEGLEEDTINLQNEADLIAKGSADYEGFVLAGVDDTDDIFVGRTNLQVSFADGGSLTGEATDFVTFIDPTGETTDTDFEPLPDDTELTEVDGSLTFSGGTLSTQPLTSFGSVAMTVEGEVTIPADISITENEEVYDIEGELVGAVTDADVFIAEGNYTAESSDAGFDGELVILAN